MCLEDVVLTPSESQRQSLGSVDCGPIVPQSSATAFAIVVSDQPTGAPVGLNGPPSPASASSPASSCEGPREAAATSGQGPPSLLSCSFLGADTTIVFDFDDTLFPTTWASSIALGNKFNSRFSMGTAELEQFVDEATGVLRSACCLADKVIIASAADRSWVELALSAAPRLQSVIEHLKIPVWCAGDSDAARNAYTANVISISPCKSYAVGESETKMVHMLEEPSLEELVEELRVLGTRLPRLAKKRYNRTRTRLTMHRTCSSAGA